MSQVFLSLGSNLGAREKALYDAREALQKHAALEVVTVSPLYETVPVGGPPQPDFLNQVVEIRCGLNPHDLLHVTREIETNMGRERRERFGPRTIDIDILFYDDIVLDTAALTLPHPRLHERFFVLEPLCDIAAQFRHPVLHTSVAELLTKLRTENTIPQCHRRLTGNGECGK